MTASVVVIGPLPPPYHGGSVATELVLRSEVARRFRVLHVDTSDRRGLENIGRFDAGNVVLAVRHASALLRLLLTEQPRVIYIPLAQNTLGALRDLSFLYPALLSRRHVVVHLHGGDFRPFFDRSGPVMRALIGTALKRVQRVIVLAEPLRESLKDLVPPERIAVLPNGIDDAFGSVPDRSARQHAGVRVLFIGNLTRAKGFLELIDAVRLLHERGFPIELDVAGDFASAADRDAAFTALRPLQDVARLHGFVDREQKRTLLEAADVFAFPSHSEGHPYVVLEAMSAGLPVIATNLPGIAATVIDGETGRLVPVGSVTALANALEELVNDQATRLRYGAAGRLRYEQHFGSAQWSMDLSRIMNDVVEAE